MPTVIANSRPGDEDVASLLFDYRWSTSPFLYFSFPTLATQFTGYPDNSEPDIGFGQLNGAQQGAVASILQQVEDLTTLVFRNAADFSKPPEEAELRFGLTDGTQTAHAYVPADHDVAGDVWFNNSSGRFAAPVRGTYAYMGFVHEIGHALGLKHPHETDFFGAMTAAHDNMNYTVMSYRSYAGMDVDAGYGNEEYGYAQTFMMYDIAALQYMYGADFGTNSGDSVYKWDPLSGKMSINGVDKLTPGANKIFMTIWDGGGVDTYDLSGYATNVVIDLNPGLWSKTSNAQLAYLGDGHFADGNIANALQYQDDNRSLIENATGGSGNDRLTGNQIANVLIGGAGYDILFGGGGNDRLEGGDNDDQLDGGTGSDTIYGGVGDDVFFDDDEFGGAGNDQFFGGDGMDSLHINRRGLGAPTQLLLDGGGGADVITFSGHSFLDDATLIGGDGDDSISAFSGHTLTIDAGAGNDRVGLFFLGAITNVTLGSGKDFLALNAYLGAPPEPGGSITVTDFEIGAAGDRLELLGYLVERLVNWDPAANPFASHLRLVQQGADTLLQIDSDGPGAAASFETLLRLQNVQITALGVYNLGGYAGDGSAPVPTTIVGTAGLDQLWGTGGDDLIQGLDSQDEIFGGGGNDRIEGGDGWDLLYGQYGDDQLFGDAGTDNLLDQEGGDDRLFGGAETDYLVILRKDGTPLSDVLLDGGDGNDRLDFNALERTDRATMIGGSGDDEIFITGNGEVIVDAGDGADHVYINYSDGHFVLTLGAGADVVVVRADFFFGAGLTLVIDDFVAGNSAGSDVVDLTHYLSQRLQNWDGTANPFHAGYLQLVQSGADTLLTRDLDGAAGSGGAATLITFRNLSVGALTAFNLGGLDVPGFSLQGTEGDDNLNGDAAANRIDGLGGDDVINGGQGDDTMAGGAGDDTYYVDSAGDLVTEAANQGRDVVYAAVSYALAAGSSVEVLSTTDAGGTAAIDLTGNELANIILGNAGANILSGGGGADTLAGFGGNDTFVGNASAPITMQGGIGDDWYYVRNPGDSVIEFAGEGNDRIFASVNYVLSAGRAIESLETDSQAGTASINLTGNNLAQTIFGNAGANILTSGGGADYLVGFAGNDILFGNADAASTLQGGTGDDWYYVSRTGDSLVEFAGEGNDRIVTSVSYTLSAGQAIETLAVADQTGAGAIDLGGNEYGQLILGNNGANTLSGGGGADDIAGLGGSDILLGDDGDDTLNGGAGSDMLNGGAGADILVFADALGAGNVDTVQGFVSGSDRIFLENAVFTGLSNAALAAGAFVTGTAAQDADDRIIYNQATGALLFDADGSGAGAAIQFATMVPGTALAASDFVVI